MNARSVTILVALVIAPSLARAQACHPNFPVTDGHVRALAVSGNTLYVGGEFQMMGYPMGGGVPVDSSAGAALPRFPMVHGIVYAAVDDGAGGWFVAGAFDRVGDSPRANLARVRGDLSVDPWNPGVDGTVYALASSGSTLYVAGAFTTVGGQQRTSVAAVNAASGAVLSWAIQVDGAIRALAMNDGILCMGGSFTKVGGQPRHHLAAVDGATAQLSPWNPDADGDVLCLSAADEILYAGGAFLHVSGIARYHIAAISLANGSLTPWNATADGTVRAIAVSGGKVYAGGDFVTIGGIHQEHLGAVSTRWWQGLDWNPGADDAVTSLLVRGGRVYVGGVFRQIGGHARFRAAILDTTLGQPTPWDPRVNGPVYAIAPSGSSLFVGGAFSSLGGLIRDGLAAIDRRTEQITDWDPEVHGFPNAIATENGVVYVGGGFDQIGGRSRHALAAIDSTTGLTLPWNPDSIVDRWYVTTLVASQTGVYVGSYEPWGHELAMIDLMAGREIWAQYVSGGGEVDKLLLADGLLYAGGDFDSVGAGVGGVRPALDGIAVLDAATGAVLPRYPDVYWWNSLASIGGVVFGSWGWGPVEAIDGATGDVLPWSLSSNGSVGCIAAGGRRVYLGGRFTTIGGQPRGSLASINAFDRTLTGWNPNVTGAVTAIAPVDDVVYTGGTFTAVDGEPHSNLAAIDDPSQLVNVPSSAVARPELLGPAAPNPFAVSAVVRFDLPRTARTTLDLIDVTGRRAKTLVDERAMAAGAHEVTLKRGGLAAGIYWLRLAVDGETTGRRIAILP